VQHVFAPYTSLRILATAWSAPAWMKDNGSLVGGNFKTTAYNAYAQYFVKSIQAYQGQGIPIYAITPLNEPGVNVPYPSMNFTAANEGAFIKNNLAPALASANLHPRLLIYDWNYGDAHVGAANDYPDAILNDSTVSPFVAGTAFHCYDGDPGVMTTVHNNHLDKDVYMDECSPGSPNGCFYPNTYPVNEVIDTMRNWSRSTVTWNIALDPNGGPFHNNGGQTPCTPMVTVNSTGTVTYTRNYYELGQVSKFVTRGAYRIDSNQSGPINDVAFKNPDGSKVLLVHNTDLSHTQAFKVRWGTESFTYALPGNGIATFKWSGTPSTTYGWGNSAYGTDSGNIYGGGASNPSDWSVTDASRANSVAFGAGFHSLYRGNPAVTSYTVSADAQLVATGTTEPYPKYGLYAGYHDEGNYVQAWIDPGPCRCFVTHGVVGNADQGYHNFPLPGGFTPSAYNTIKVVRSGATFQFYSNNTLEDTETWDIDHGQNNSGQVGLVTQDAQANFRNVTVL